MKRLILGLVLILAPATALAQPADNAKPAPPEEPPADTAGAPAEPPAENVPDPTDPTTVGDPGPTPDPAPVGDVPPVEEPPPPPEPMPVATPDPAPVDPEPAVATDPTAATTEVVPETHAAPSKLTAGVKGGVNAGTQSGSGANDPGMHFGVCLGVFITYDLSSSLAVHTEVLMSDKGADYTDIIGNNADEALLYVDVPVFARYNMPIGSRLTAFGFGGPAVAYLVDSKNTMKGDLNPLDISVAAGAGVDIKAGKRSIVVDLRFSQGLLNALDNGSGDTVRNRLISLYAGVTL